MPSNINILVCETLGHKLHVGAGMLAGGLYGLHAANREIDAHGAIRNLIIRHGNEADIVRTVAKNDKLRELGAAAGAGIGGVAGHAVHHYYNKSNQKK